MQCNRLPLVPKGAYYMADLNRFAPAYRPMDDLFVCEISIGIITESGLVWYLYEALDRLIFDVSCFVYIW